MTAMCLFCSIIKLTIIHIKIDSATQNEVNQEVSVLSKTQCLPPHKTPKVMTETAMTTRVEVSGRES